MIKLLHTAKCLIPAKLLKLMPLFRLKIKGIKERHIDYIAVVIGTLILAS